MSDKSSTCDIFLSTNRQKVLSFLAKFSDAEFHEREIARAVGISYGSANKVLNELHAAALLTRKQKGKMLFYTFNPDDPILEPLKIVTSLALLRPLVAQLKRVSARIVLFGSCAKGDETSQSDMDLFVITNHADKVYQILFKFRLPQGFEQIEIQPVVLSPLEMMKSEKTDAEFLSLVREGIVLWESGWHETGIQEVSE